MEKDELPIGLGFALAQNPDAMRIFANLSESGRAEVLQRARSVSSKTEMQNVVDGLSAQS